MPQISQPATPAGLALDLGEAESRKSMMCCKRRLVSTVAIGAVCGTLARVRVVARTVIFMALRWASVTSGLACNCCTSGRATVSAVAREWSLEMAAALAEACAVSLAGKAASQPVVAAVKGAMSLGVRPSAAALAVT